MILEKSTKEFRIFFLKEFTRQLIKHSNSAPFFELKKFVEEQEKSEVEKIKEQKEEIKKVVQDRVRLNENFSDILLTKEPSIDKEISQPIKFKSLKNINKKIISERKVLRIPEPRLPQNLSYLRPIPTQLKIDLGKLNPYVKDPNVNEIECPGAEENIVVKGSMGTKNTNIKLSKEEIDEIINTISKSEKIPADEGIFRVVLGNLNFSAIISEVVGTKFIIKKLSR